MIHRIPMRIEFRPSTPSFCLTSLSILVRSPNPPQPTPLRRKTKQYASRSVLLLFVSPPEPSARVRLRILFAGRRLRRRRRRRRRRIFTVFRVCVRFHRNMANAIGFGADGDDDATICANRRQHKHVNMPLQMLCADIVAQNAPSTSCGRCGRCRCRPCCPG